MKKLFIITSAILLLAAACNKVVLPPAQNQSDSQQHSQLTPPPFPSLSVKDNSGGQNNSEQKNMTSPPPPTFPSIGGVLKLSNNPAKGNLMLTGIGASEYSKNVLYIKTKRDFSSLIGKEVVIYIEGPPYDFTLLDIKAAQ